MKAGMELRQLGEGVWTVSVDDHRALFAEGNGSALAINAFGTPQAAAAMHDAIATTVPDKPLRTLVATIDHLDHIGCAAELAAGAEVIAHELCARVLERRAGAGGLRATHVVQGPREDLVLDGVTLRLLYEGPTQGSGGLAVHLPAQRVLYLVGPRGDARYGLFPDMHFRHLTRLWRDAAALEEVDVVAPGRGPLTDPAGLRRAADYVDAVAAASQHAFAEGVPIWVYDAMEAYVGPRLRDRFGDLDGFERHVGIAAIRLVHYYLTGGWGLEDTREPSP
jgi:glyoxylase-like metal-dependent hydrolase (beta-lactamase superfamily II)